MMMMMMMSYVGLSFNYTVYFRLIGLHMKKNKIRRKPFYCTQPFVNHLQNHY